MKRNSLTTAVIAGIAGVAGFASLANAAALPADNVVNIAAYECRLDSPAPGLVPEVAFTGRDMATSAITIRTKPRLYAGNDGGGGPLTPTVLYLVAMPAASASVDT